MKNLPLGFWTCLAATVQLHGHPVVVLIQWLSSGDVDSGELEHLVDKLIFFQAVETLQHVGSGIKGRSSDAAEMSDILTTWRQEQVRVCGELFHTNRALLVGICQRFIIQVRQHEMS